MCYGRRPERVSDPETGSNSDHQNLANSTVSQILPGRKEALNQPRWDPDIAGEYFLYKTLLLSSCRQVDKGTCLLNKQPSVRIRPGRLCAKALFRRGNYWQLRRAVNSVPY